VLKNRPGALGDLLVVRPEPAHHWHYHRPAVARGPPQRRLQLLLDHGLRGQRLLRQQAHQQVGDVEALAHVILQRTALPHLLDIPEHVESADLQLLD
jgi:hypothetical protein